MTVHQYLQQLMQEDLPEIFVLKQESMRNDVFVSKLVEMLIPILVMIKFVEIAEILANLNLLLTKFQDI